MWSITARSNYVIIDLAIMIGPTRSLVPGVSSRARLIIGG